jgi:hypothetical protein
MKHPITSLTTTALILTAVVIFSAVSTPTTAQAAIVCPTGYTCVPKTQTEAVVCPAGYVCTPKSETTSLSRPTTTYRPGSYTNLILRPQEQTLTPAQIQVATQAQAVASTTATSSGQQLTAAQIQALQQMQTATETIGTTSATANTVVTGSRSIDSGRISSGVVDPFVHQWTYGSGILEIAGVAIYNPVGGVATVAGQPLTPRCAANQYYDYAGSGGSGCYAQQMVSPALNSIVKSTTVSEIVQDPYCSNARVGIYGYIYEKEYSTCVMGEASRVSSYVNPYMSIVNIFGVVVGQSTPADRTAKTIPSTNLCKTAVSLKEAKQMDAASSASSTQSKYFTLSRLLASGRLTLDMIEQRNIYMVTGHNGYYWNGKNAYQATGVFPNDGSLQAGIVKTTDHPYDISDWSNPKFQSFIQNMQFDALGVTVNICLDDNYKSNFPMWSSHLSALMAHSKAAGLWPTQ